MVNSPEAVENLLNTKGIRYTPAGRDLLIQCLNPEHTDNTPSLRIDKVFGYGRCFSCGFKVNLFNYFGIRNNILSLKALSIKEKILKIYSDSKGLEMPNGWTPFNEDFRGIPRDVLREYGAFNFPVNTNKDFENRIAFPMVTVDKKIVCFIGRHKLSGASPRYLIYPNKVRVPTFPSRFDHDNGTLILVEGIFDCLNLISKGVKNVEAIMGVTTIGGLKGINKEIVKLMKLSGVTKLVLLFDGDEAGIKQAEMYKPMLENEGFIVEVIDLPEDTDPGDLSQTEVDMLRKLI